MECEQRISAHLNHPYCSVIRPIFIVSMDEHLGVNVCVCVWNFNIQNVRFVLLLSLRSFLCCREPRGFGFVQYLDPADAEDAKYHMDGQILLGRELTVVFAEENRKKPVEMRARQRVR